MKKYVKKIIHSMLAIYVSLAVILIVVFSSFYYAYGHYMTVLISDKNEKVVAYASKNNIENTGKIVFYGDSITEMCDTSLYYPEFDIINRGISGDTTSGMLERLQDNLLNIQPSTVVFLGGTNDIGKKIPTDQIAKNIESILSSIKEKCPNCKIIVQSVYPVNKHVRPHFLNQVNNRSNDAVAELNSALVELCQRYDYTYVDVYSYLTDSDGNLNREYTRDGLHLIKKGYFKVAEIIKPYLIPQNPTEL
ncbi:MAG: lysophospholipase [Clostridia bacterium]|nr:lysophospholipase [Clostridia bacterium]